MALMPVALDVSQSATSSPVRPLQPENMLEKLRTLPVFHLDTSNTVSFAS